MEPALDWREVHRSRGSTTTVAWSPCGRHLCCADSSGQVVVVDTDTRAARTLAEPPVDEDHSVAIAAWVNSSEVIVVRADSLRVINLEAMTLAVASEFKGHTAWVRPHFDGYAWVESASDRSQLVFVSLANAVEPTPLNEPFNDVRDLAWSPDGCHLAIACGSKVVVVQPGADGSAEAATYGPANSVIWLDERRIAVACVDTNIRIYAWPFGVERSLRSHSPSMYGSANVPGAELVGLIEVHDDFVEGLTGPNEHGQFASWDDATLNVWGPAANGYALLHSEKWGARRRTPSVAMHPQRPLLARAIDSTVCVADFVAPSAQVLPPPKLELTPTLSEVLGRAGIIGTAVHSDSVAKAWRMGYEGSGEAAVELAQAGRLRKATAIATRQILQHVECALRGLWSQPSGEAALVLQTLAQTQAFASAIGAVRQKLLALLAAEIVADRPRMRDWASVAYLGIGFLGLEDAERAFGSVSTDSPVLRMMTFDLRSVWFAATNLLENPNLDTLAEAAQAAAVIIDTVLTQRDATGISRLMTDVPHTLILNGGGAKGLAHFGAILELDRHYPFDRFVGTSAGAILAVMLGAGYKGEELLAKLKATDFHKLIVESWPGRIKNLLREYGLFSGEDLQNWIGARLKEKLISQQNPQSAGKSISQHIVQSEAQQELLLGLPVRMAHLRADLRTTVYACGSLESKITFDSMEGNHTRDAASFAARCSMSIPFYFTSQMVGGYRVFDGFLRMNYPIDIVSQEVPREKIIGLYLASPGIKDAGSSFLDALVHAWEAKDRQLAVDFANETIVLMTHPIGLLDFKLSDEEKEFLVLVGRVGALEFLERRRVTPAVDRAALSLKLETLREKLIEDRRHTRRRRWIVVAALLLALIVCVGSDTPQQSVRFKSGAAKQNANPKVGVHSKKQDFLDKSMVAEAGFEPTTFGL